MLNAVGRDIPDYLLVNGREVYQGKNYKDGQLVKKATPTTVRHEKPQEDKLCATIREACEKCGANDGMTFSFHTEFRDGDYVAAMVCKVMVGDQERLRPEKCILISFSLRLQLLTAAVMPKDKEERITVVQP